MKFFKIIACILFLASSNLASAQKSYTKDADNAYMAAEYFTAIDLYKKAYSKEKDKAKKAEILFLIAQCYKNINDTKQAETWFAKAIKAKYENPKAVLYLADAKKINEKYDEALIEYNNYKALVPGDPKGEDGAKSCELAQKWKDEPTRYKVENIAMINTKFSEFSPAYAKKDYKALIFTSTREGSTGNELDGTTGESFSDLYKTTIDKKGKWSTPQPLSATVNSQFNEGGSFLNSKANTIYFTRCPTEKGKNLGCQILTAKAQGQDWADATVIPLAADSFTVGQPTLNEDETIMYFASDMTGGQGGKDIWMTTFDKKEKTWSAPVNLGNSINTSGDEMFPFLHPDGTLYFSSNGHLGMGGLDIFYSEKSGETWGPVNNMKYPINSSGDDFAIIFEGKNERGFLSSNRAGGKGADDIYAFVLPPLVFTLQGVVTDVDTKAKISGAKIQLVGTDGTSVEAITEKDGSYSFKLASNTSYSITASAEKYLSDKAKETTVGVEQSKTFEHNFALKTISKPIEMPNIFYDLGKWDLRPESMISLDALVSTLNDNPNITIKIGSHTDSRASNKDNEVLSQKRAQSVVDYLISKGIAADRLEAKGYGEERLLVTDAQINKLKTTEEKEAAHQRNRRTDFEVLRTDYVPKKPAEGAPKTDEPKTDAPKTDAPKNDAPKTDGEKAAPKTDGAPKTAEPKTEEKKATEVKPK